MHNHAFKSNGSTMKKKSGRKAGRRASWKGSLRFGLVSIDVEAFNARSSEGGDIHFHQLHAKCHRRIHYAKSRVRSTVKFRTTKSSRAMNMQKVSMSKWMPRNLTRCAPNEKSHSWLIALLSLPNSI